jgi:hypothetical protein
MARGGGLAGKMIAPYTQDRTPDRRYDKDFSFKSINWTSGRFISLPVGLLQAKVVYRHYLYPNVQAMALRLPRSCAVPLRGFAK